MTKSSAFCSRASALCVLLGAGCVSEAVDDEDEAYDHTEQAVCNNDCDDDPEGGPSSRPEPKTPKLTNRTQTSLTVQYAVEAEWTSFALQRRPFGGAWTSATTAGSGTDATRTFIDSGKNPDSRDCYRVRAANSLGTSYSPEACGLTMPALGTVNPRLSRLQLLVKVANVTDAGTDAMVTARLNGMAIPAYHLNALNPAPRLVNGSWVDSFARNNTFTYELELAGERRLRDITEISVHNWGTDALCVERIELLVNEGTAMTKDFGATTCRWIETETGSPNAPELVVPFEELRAATSFTSFTPPSFDGVDRAEVEARLEGIVGNRIWNLSTAKWGRFSGDRAVEAQRLNASTLHVDLDLEGIINNFPNVEVDLDFDLTVAFAASATEPGFDLTFDVANVISGADFAWWAEVLAGLSGPLGITGIELLEYFIEQGIKEAFTFDAVGFPFGELACAQPTVTVNTDAGLTFGCNL